MGYIIFVLVLGVAIFLWKMMYKQAQASVVHTHSFRLGEVVRFRPNAARESFVDKDQHRVIKIEPIAIGVIGLLDYPDTLQMAGHHQRITLENGQTVSGAWLVPDEAKAD